VNQWNFTIEREIAEGLALRAAYVGSFGFHGLLSIDPNTISPQICANAAGCASGGILAPNVPPGNVPQGAQYIPVQTTRPNPFVGAGFFWHTEGNSSYNGLQIDVTKRMARGLQFRANYTWSKNLDTSSAAAGSQSSNQLQTVYDRDDMRRDWGPAATHIERAAAGWSDEAIYDAVSVCALFNFYNRWCDGSGVQPMQPEQYAASGKRLAAFGYQPPAKPG